MTKYVHEHHHDSSFPKVNVWVKGSFFTFIGMFFWACTGKAVKKFFDLENMTFVGLVQRVFLLGFLWNLGRALEWRRAFLPHDGTGITFLEFQLGVALVLFTIMAWFMNSTMKKWHKRELPVPEAAYFTLAFVFAAWVFTLWALTIEGVRGGCLVGDYVCVNFTTVHVRLPALAGLCFLALLAEMTTMGDNAYRVLRGAPVEKLSPGIHWFPRFPFTALAEVMGNMKMHFLYSQYIWR
jgi:hypothetical protein